MTPGTSQREYHLLRCLGRGGFGEVYLARIRSPAGQFELDAAVKLLHGRLSPDSDAVARLRDEGRLLALVDHPAILGVRDLLELDGRVALVTEYIDGQDLSGLLRGANAALPLRGLLEAVGIVADALHAARTTLGRDGRPLQIVHRDIKPSNIRISRHGGVKLLDFGIARSDATAREAETATDTILGSLPYMAPERFDSNNIDPASDVYALGCVLFEGLAGRVLFDQPMPVMIGLAHTPERHAAHVAKRVEALVGAPADVVALLLATLTHDVAGRPTAREVADRCDALAQATAGPTLRAWARDRVWPEAKKFDGELDGRVLTEGAATVRDLPTVRDVAVAATDAPTIDAGTMPLAASARGWAPWLGAGLGVGGVVVFGGFVVVAVVAGALALRFGPTGGAPEGAEPPVAVPAAPVATPPSAEVPAEPAAGPEEAVGPVEVALPATPERVVVAPTAPLVRAPTPDAGATVVAAPRTTGSVSTGPQWRLTLRDASGAYALGEVPAGTYEILSDFGEGTVPAGSLTVGAGEALLVTCNKPSERCGVAP